MRSLALLSLLPVAAVVALDAAELDPSLDVLAQRTVSNSCNGGGPIPDGDFVKVNGTSLVDSKGEKVYIAGLNYWSCMNLAASASAGGNQSRLYTELDQMAAAGVNHLRIMASSEGAPTIQPFRMYPALMPSPYHWDEDIFKGLDLCLSEMSKRGMRATMTLANTWNWSGGFGQYISWTTGNGSIPYPPSWDPTAAPQPWGNYTTNSTGWGAFEDYANQFYTSAASQAIWHAHIEKVVNRKNTVSGKIYKDDPAIMTWELANEPEPVNQGATEDPTDPVLAWLKSSSAFIKSLTPNQLVTTGAEGKYGEWWQKAFHNFTTIDYITAHMWVQNWGYYDMLNKSAANLENAMDFATAFLTNNSQWALDLGKPVLLEEFGMARDNWENNAKALADHNKTYIYSSVATTNNKDTYFAHAFDLVLGFFKANQAFVGAMPWAYGGIWRPEALYRNKYNEAWAGDPPHEAPGWYDIYDTDKALQLILAESINATAWISSGKGHHHHW